jgi:hypothetical protein
VNALELAQAIYGHPIVRFVGALIAANILTGLAAALFSPATMPFRLAAVGDWLFSRAIPYLLGAGAVQLLLMATPPDFADKAQMLGNIVWGFVVAALIGKVIQNLKELGIPLPEQLGDKPKAETKVAP